ncbi:MAG: RNA methyltransferase [Candidatus Gastranaerophilales bacterium]|nr:RNA methyltransferase [Candidatus Gastranaerophilales bacterium]
METQKITSTQNNLVKFAIKLQNPKFRKTEQLILLDGEKTIQGIIENEMEFEYFFAKEDYNIKNAKIKNYIQVTDEILKKISTTKTPTNAVGIIKEPQIEKNIFKKLNKIALIDGIKDPGNLGTIIRSAVAFSIDGIILFNDCVDLYNSKTIRATAQNMFKIPIIHTSDINFINSLKSDRKLISTVVTTKNELFNYKFDEKFIIAFGSEADGISEEILKISDEKVTLKMDNEVESINLGVCASITFALCKINKK